MLGSRQVATSCENDTEGTQRSVWHAHSSEAVHHGIGSRAWGCGAVQELIRGSGFGCRTAQLARGSSGAGREFLPPGERVVFSVHAEPQGATDPAAREGRRIHDLHLCPSTAFAESENPRVAAGRRGERGGVSKGITRAMMYVCM